MSESSGVPTSATLMRFNFTPHPWLKEYEIWTLELPVLFQEAIWQFKMNVENRLQSLGKPDRIAPPTRQLNNTLMSIFPTLVHAFEIEKRDVNKRPIYTPCLAITKSSAPVQLPNPENIQHVIREWALLWTEQKYITDIPEDERTTLRSKLIAAINTPIKDWKWKLFSANQLLGSYNPYESLNYEALPSLLAALLHGKMSTIHDKQIQWRKVQDGKSKRLSIVGFINQRPIKAEFSIRKFNTNKSGEGYFSYKLDFHLETQAGRNRPWMFVSVHAQRYAHEALTHPNDRRRVSILTAANRARLDDFDADLTLIKLRTKDTSKEDAKTNFQWDDNLAELLSRIDATPLESPNHILDAPQNYWRASRFAREASKDEYYIIHAEGYKYGDHRHGHQLETGFSMAESAAVFKNIVSEHLPMLQLDVPLQADNLPTPSGRRKPLALNDYTVWSTLPTLKPPEWGTSEARDAERHERYLQQRSRYQQIAQETLARAMRGRDILITVLWTNEDTRNGICKALEEAFLLNPGDSYPPNVKIIERFFKQTMLEPFNKPGFPYKWARHQRVMEWRQFLQQELPPHPNRLAIIETLGKKKGWGVKGTIREACASERIASQMVETIRMKPDDAGNLDYLAGSHEHRANSAAHEVALRHIGALYGDPQEIYQAAGINEQNLEVLALFLRSTQTNIKYPMAVKLAYDGAIEVSFPGSSQWLLYRDAAPALGQIFAGEWLNTTFDGVKRKIADDRKHVSELWYEKTKLSNFVLHVLKTLRRPTIALIEAENWRNFDVWPQLGNQKLHKNPNTLDFSPNDRIYKRNDPLYTNLLAAIRLRADHETPQYLTNTYREFTRLSGFIDTHAGNLFHYFSIGRQLVTSRGQALPNTRHATMLDGIGAGVAYKYPQVVEFVPFFVREDYADLEGLKKLCRVPHYLRISPAWPQGNIVLPYPVHLAQQLVEDQLCILGMDL